MLDVKIFNDIAEKVSGALPPALKNYQQEIEKNVKAALQSACAKLNLVTREEFDLQTQLLAKSREQLKALEQRLAELEANRK